MQFAFGDVLAQRAQELHETLQLAQQIGRHVQSLELQGALLNDDKRLANLLLDAA